MVLLHMLVVFTCLLLHMSAPTTFGHKCRCKPGITRVRPEILVIFGVKTRNRQFKTFTFYIDLDLVLTQFLFRLNHLFQLQIPDQIQFQ